MEDNEYRDIREVRPCISEDPPNIIWSSRGSNELGFGGGGGVSDGARSDGEDSETSHKCFVSLPSSHRSSQDSSAESCYTGWGSIGGGGGLSKKSKKAWKKLLKMEMMRLVEEQDTVWKEAQNAMDGMERRVEVLEDAKTKLEDSFEHLRYDMRRLRGGRVGGGQQEGVAVVSPHLSLAKMETGDAEVDLSRRYSSMYTSPIFEEKKVTPRLRSLSGRMKTVNCDHLPAKDSELRKLKSEIHKLRLQIEGRDNKLAQTLMHHQESPSSVSGYLHMTKFSPRFINVNEINGVEQKSFAEDNVMLEDMRNELWINDCSRERCTIQGCIQQEDENEANMDMGVKRFQISPKVLENSLQEYISTNTSFQDSSNAQDGGDSSVSESIYEKPIEGGDLPRLKMTLSTAGKSHNKNVNVISEQLSDVQSVNDMGECLDLKESQHLYRFSPKLMKLAKKNDNLLNEACKCTSFRSEELEGLKFLLQASRQKCEEEMARNKFLEERLQKQVEEQKKLVDEHALKLERTEKALWQAHELNNMLTKRFLKSETTLTDLLAPYKGTFNVQSSENQISELQMINNMHGLREMRDGKEIQGKSDLLKQSVEEKEEQIGGNMEYSRQDFKIQEEVESNNPVSMSQDISHFFHENEKKVSSLEMEVRKLQQDLKESAGGSSGSSRTFPTEMDLATTQKDITNLKFEEEEFKSRYNSILSKVCSAKKDLRKREDALERLRKELVAIVKGDSTRDEGSYVILRRSTDEDQGDNIGQYNTHNPHHHRNNNNNNNNQSVHHCLIIELEGKLTTMEEELLRARNEMARLKDENVTLRRSSWSSMHNI